MGYYLDLTQVSLDQYRDILREQILLPSRVVLRERSGKYFDSLKQFGLKTLQELIQALSSTKRMNDVSVQTDIPFEYLNLLRRELGSIQPKVLSLGEFEPFFSELVLFLRKEGFQTTKELFEQEEHLLKLIKDKPNYIQDFKVLFCLCDLIRINGVGPLAALSFYEAGYSSLESIAKATSSQMLIDVTKVNEVKHYYQTKLGLKDFQFCIDYALRFQRFTHF